MQLGRALRGAALPPQTAQQDRVLRFLSHGEDGTRFHVLGRWFLLTRAKQLLLSQLWLYRIQSLVVLSKVNQAQKTGYCCVLIVPINPGRSSWGCVSQLSASRRSCKTHSTGNRVILLLSWGDPAKPRKETETEAPGAFWNQKPLRHTEQFVLEISGCRTRDFLRAP